jgi:hypothetical protein
LRSSRFSSGSLNDFLKAACLTDAASGETDCLMKASAISKLATKPKLCAPAKRSNEQTTDFDQ